MLPRRSSRTATTAAASKNWITEYKEKSDRANYITTGNGEKKQNDRHFKLRAWLARTVSAARDPRLYGGRGKSTGVWKVAGRTRFTAKSQVRISDWEHTDDREKSTVRGRRLNALRDINLSDHQVAPKLINLEQRQRRVLQTKPRRFSMF